MRRVLTMMFSLSLFATGLASLGSTAAGADDSTTVWKLVNRTCTGNEVEAGRACFDPAGHAADWEQVAESSANGKVEGSKQDYTYRLPDVISDDQANLVQLHAQVSQISDGGAHARICLSGPFGHKESGDPCATTDEAPNGQSASKDATLTLNANVGSPGQVVTVTIGFEEPGGYVNFNYRATDERNTVVHQYSGTYALADPGTKFKKIHFTGSGTFRVTGPLRADMEGNHVDGTATWRFHFGGGSHTVDLNLIAGSYTYRHRVDLEYEVTDSNLRCLPVGHHVKVTASDPRRFSFHICGDEDNDFGDNSMHVDVALS